MKLRERLLASEGTCFIEAQVYVLSSDLSDHSALRIVFEKYSNFPTGSDLWTDRSKNCRSDWVRQRR